MSQTSKFIEAIEEKRTTYKVKVRDGHGGHSRHIRNLMENAVLYIDKMLDPYNDHPNPADNDSENTLLDIKSQLNEACNKIKSVKETRKRRF